MRIIINYGARESLSLAEYATGGEAKGPHTSNNMHMHATVFFGNTNTRGEDKQHMEIYLSHANKGRVQRSASCPLNGLVNSRRNVTVLFAIGYDFHRRCLTFSLQVVLKLR